MFYRSEFQAALESQQLELTKEGLLNFFKSWPRSGGILKTQPKNGFYKCLCFYETDTKGVTLSIEVKEEKGNERYSTSRKVFYNWEKVANGILEICPTMYKQLSLFNEEFVG